MDASRARELIAPLLGSPPARVTPIDGGWDFDTFDVDGEWIFRFPKLDINARSLERELNLLPALADHVPFAVPRPVHHGIHDGRRFAGYRKIPGRTLRPSDGENQAILADLAAFLRSLHSFPLDHAREIVGVDGTVEGWHEEFSRLRTQFEEEVAPLISREVADAAREGFDDFVGSEFEPALVHNDLGAEHILVDGSRLLGVIDFGDATVGDPAIDLVGLWITLRPAAALRTAEACGYPDVEERVRFYVWMGAVHAIFHGLEMQDEEEVREACEGLALRLGC